MGIRLGGRKKGTPNKFSATLKGMILQALSDAGGVDYLRDQATKNPTAFLALLGRVLPLQMKDGGAEPVVPKLVVHEFVHDSDPGRTRRDLPLPNG